MLLSGWRKRLASSKKKNREEKKRNGKEERTKKEARGGRRGGKKESRGSPRCRISQPCLFFCLLTVPSTVSVLSCCCINRKTFCWSWRERWSCLSPWLSLSSRMCRSTALRTTSSPPLTTTAAHGWSSGEQNAKTSMTGWVQSTPS